MKKRVSALILACAIALSLCLSAAGSVTPAYADDGQVTITVYNWGQYISDGTEGYIDVIKEFEAAYPNIHVNYLTYDSNETMYTKLKTGGATYDVIIPSDYMIEKLIREDMLLELDFSNIPNYELVDEGFKNMAYDPENKYSVPYTWGYVGIIYNSAFVNPDDVTGWDVLWNPNYAGKILMFDNCRDSFAIAELLEGVDINTNDPDQLKIASDKLKAQKYLVQSYVMDQIFDKMERAEAWIAPYYAGDYLLMAEENPDLEFCAPKEGFNLFVDACCIPTACEHKKEAELFINFLCEPEISGENLDYLGYSTPISAAKEYMDEEMAENPIAYPSDEILGLGRSFNALSEEGNQKMNDLWLQVKTTGGSVTFYIVITVAAVVLIAAIWIISVVRRKRRIARRCTH